MYRVMDAMERAYITYYDSMNNGYNLTSGGQIRQCYSEESRKKMSLAKKGKHLVNGGTFKKGHKPSQANIESVQASLGHKTVVYDSNNNIVGTYICERECARQLGIGKDIPRTHKISGKPYKG